MHFSCIKVTKFTSSVCIISELVVYLCIKIGKLNIIVLPPFQKVGSVDTVDPVVPWFMAAYPRRKKVSTNYAASLPSMDDGVGKSLFPDDQIQVTRFACDLPV